ncbi:MAG: TetR family transcriptional regulator [Clostridiales bacterium]|nr:TetR family transcriptional regulator [Clostridiales bacterium]
MTALHGTKINAAREKSMMNIIRATLELLKTKPFRDITVQEICDSAHVTRRTFYRIFDSKEKVIEVRFDMMFYHLKQALEISKTNARSVIRFCFEYFSKERDFASVFVERDLEHTITAKIVEYVEVAYSDSLYYSVSFEPAYADYYFSFVASGIIAIMRIWIANGFKHPVHTMTVLTGRLLSGVIL